jgi:hypothetical protein
MNTTGWTFADQNIVYVHVKFSLKIALKNIEIQRGYVPCSSATANALKINNNTLARKINSFLSWI